MFRRFGFLAAVAVILIPAFVQADQPQAFRYTEGKSGKAELKYVNDLPVLVVEGTPEEMGQQAGELTKDALKRMLGFSKEFLKAMGYEKRWPMLVEVSKGMSKQFPPDHVREIDALVKSGDIDRELVIVGNTFADISKAGGCSTLIVEADRSASGKPMFGRNLDYPTLGKLQSYSLVTIYRPKGKHAFVSIGFPGLIGVLSGMNDAGLSLATLESYVAKDGAPTLNPKGVAYTLLYRRILEECTTVDDAEKLLRSAERTTMNNLAICDRNGGVVFEFTPKTLAVRRAEKGICPCTNHFRTEELAKDTKCRRYDALSKAWDIDKLDRAAVAKLMHAANQGEFTLQTMIFEPADRKLFLALGKCPTSALPMKELDLTPYFER
jgi:predicted choloylglycine hydrolase